MRGAHPRACGENGAQREISSGGSGSSPRVRGKLAGEGEGGRPLGLIPARAGKTWPSQPGHFLIRAHPRACGENGAQTARVLQPGGSSPRVRGKRRGRGRRARARRLIPARAGKTCSIQGDGGSVRAHPRACGENNGAYDQDRMEEGSSPRVRGKPGVAAALVPSTGLIPARAGKTDALARRRKMATAHPRACGENSDIARLLRIDAGSSPRVRGKPGQQVVRDELHGLIPARAGKTRASGQGGAGQGAHPRACGENLLQRPPRLQIDGSSPRVRGKRGSDEDRVHPPGLIPARAGKTFICASFPLTLKAHPRACGENFSSMESWATDPGSSPRVRGKRSWRTSRPPSGRLIPARAGKTRDPRTRPVRGPAHPRACGENEEKSDD